MKVCYIWVRNFDCLKAEGINLSNDEFFEFDYIKNTLNLVESSDTLRFFFGKHIDSITALLGENGSGKTTSLELICRSLSDYHNIRSDFILVCKKNKEYYLLSNIRERMETNFPCVFVETLSEIGRVKPIFFSNVFDQNYIEFDDCVIDLSINRKMNPSYQYKDEVSRKLGPLEEQIKFLQSREAREANFKIPPKIEFKLFRNSSQSLRFRNRKNPYVPRDSSTSDRTISDSLRGLFIREKHRFKKKDMDMVAKISLDIRHQFLANLFGFDEKLDKFLTDLLLDENQSLTTEDILEQLSNENHFWFYEHPLNEIISFVLLELEGLFENSGFEYARSSRGSKHTFSIYVDENKLWKIQKLVHVFERIIQTGATWLGYSSGQKAYINLFASIWHELSENYDTEQQSILVCIDEGDLYLHPQWQIEFVSNLVSYLPIISKSNVQIVFTTHSPLLVTDLPSKCVHLLGQDNTLPKNLKTFGANIHEIYRGAFGMKQNRTGLISQKVIEDVFKITGKEKVSDDDVNKLNTIKELLDNSLIKHHINEFLDNTSKTSYK